MTLCLCCNFDRPSGALFPVWHRYCASQLQVTHAALLSTLCAECLQHCNRPCQPARHATEAIAMASIVALEMRCNSSNTLLSCASVSVHAFLVKPFSSTATWTRGVAGITLLPHMCLPHLSLKMLCVHGTSCNIMLICSCTNSCYSS